MILSCNSCGKKFVVPDSAISTSGRTVQCGSCGNKWKQFPINEIKKTQSDPRNNNNLSRQKKIQQKTQKSKKRPIRKTREINLYSPEYLAKKHGIKLNNEGVNESSSEKKNLFWIL